MITVKINNLEVAKKLVQSVLAFSADAKFEVTPEGVKIPLKCDIPDKMRIVFTSNVITSSEPVGLCIKEASRFYRAIDLVYSELGKPDLADMDLAVSDRQDFLIYKNGSLQFKIGLATDRALAGCIDTAKVEYPQEIYSFKLNVERIKALFRQSAIVRSSEARIFLIRGEGQEIAAKLEDEESLSSGMVAIKIADCLESGEFSPAIIKADMFKSLTKFPYEECSFRQHVNKALSVVAQSTYGNNGLYIKTEIVFAPKKAKRG
jgi:hypothetical protein